MEIRKWSVVVAIPLCLVSLSSTKVIAEGKPGRTEVINNMVVFESDIFVDRIDQNKKILRGTSLSATTARWPNGVLPYQFHPALNEAAIELVESAIDHWNELSTVTLEARDPDASDAPVDYVEFVSGPGCASWVGRQGQVQEIWVSSFCTTGSLIHEIGHALGLLHEHTRSDRDQYIQINWDNIQSDKTFNFEVSPSGAEDRGVYDYASIMHYGDYFFSATGRPTIVPLAGDPDTLIGQRKALSDGDLETIKNLYATDLNLGVGLEVIDDDTTEVSFTTGNLHENGAHGVEIWFSAENSLPVAFTGDKSGTCQKTNNGYRCAIGTVPGGDIKLIRVTLPGQLSEKSLNAAVVSKTFDLNSGNNTGASEAEFNLLLARAGDDSANLSSTSSSSTSGGGANHLLGVAVLFVLSFVRLSGLSLSRPRSCGFGPGGVSGGGQGLAGLGARRRALPGLRRFSNRHFSRKL